ncbi:MAG: AI-2E family transporter [Porticoccus sp.]|jgi:putative permease|uniref:AI-2E family transporter n=1 Tax=Porticoccus sp. TaxID=2024853 RepID=UPI000C0C6318|nr:AI-2E family transporter [Porticoccus sp.]MAZ69163.1 AI-2E family transporter [Porticoccus sp.]PHS74483.1 MAG: AI-2E family transporter [Porticoccus sp.]|tara:strand:- start:28358 stop:29428 length:1071 start_codon:yes stop_codon:yes gene_type:complete
MWKVLGTWVDRYFGEEEAVLLALMLVIALIVMVTFGQILAPFVAAIIFAFLLQGGVNRLVRWRVPRLVAVVLVFLLFVGVFLTILIVVLPLIGRQAANLASEIPDMIRHWQSVLLLLPEEYPHLISESQLKELLGQASKEVASMAERLVSFSFSTFPSLVIMMVYLVLVPLLVFFMLKDKDELLDLLASMLPQERPVMWRIWHEMNLQMANYVRGKAIEILVVGLVSYVFFLFMGLQYAALLGLLVGLSVVIPYIGAMIVTFPIAAVGYFQWGFGSELLWLMVGYGIIQALDGNVLVPLLFSEAVNLHPIAIILAVLVFGGLWGFWGVFFAIPLATLVKALYNAWPRTDLPNPLSE